MDNNPYKKNGQSGLVNYETLINKLNNAIELAHQQHKLVAVIMVSLHQLKKINVEFGHKCGDELVEMVGERLLSLPIECKAIANFHGTNFILIIEGIETKSDVEKIVSKILHVLHQPVLISDQQHIPSITAGISLYPDNALLAEELIDKAFQAGHRAHLNGSEKHVFYAKRLSSGSQLNRILENDLLLALKNEEFRLLFQPQINTKTNKIEGVEALARWFNLRLGEISPVFFIPIAENTGLINLIGEWVIERACNRISYWKKEGVVSSDFFVSVNVSPIQLESNTLCDFILNALDRYKIPHDQFQVELTETGLMQNIKSSIKQLTFLKKNDVKIAVDDFGTGYSSLTHLSNLPVDIIKLDKSFVASINEPMTQMVVKSIIDLAHQLNLSVTAEGVETEEQLNILKEFDCDFIQGFYFSIPINEEKLLKKLKEG